MRLVDAITSAILSTASANPIKVRWIESTNASVRNTYSTKCGNAFGEWQTKSTILTIIKNHFLKYRSTSGAVKLFPVRMWVVKTSKISNFGMMIGRLVYNAR